MSKSKSISEYSRRSAVWWEKDMRYDRTHDVDGDKEKALAPEVSGKTKSKGRRKWTYKEWQRYRVERKQRRGLPVTSVYRSAKKKGPSTE